MKFKRNLLILSAILIGILIVVAGCLPTTPTTVAVTGVTLNQTTMALPTGGATETLVATVAPATATNTSVTWSSSTPTVATVANGVVTSVAAGTTTITVTTVDGSFTATCAVTVSSVVVISTAAILGVTAPVTGATPVTTITAATQYTGTVTWSPTATTFAASTVYTATITLTPKTGYTLTGVAANLFTVSGATDTNPVNSGIVTAVFPATAAVATITTAAILGVTKPVTGATPVTTITAATQYTGTVTWSPTVTTTFAASTAYTATITLTPTTGYTLTGVAANLFTVTGATSDTNSANLGVVTAVFAATAAPVIATASTIANAASAPTVTVTGTSFKTTIAASDLTVVVGATGLTLGTVTYVSATQITVAFTGTAAAGNVTIQAKTSAFTPAAGAASNTLTVTVPAATTDTTAPTATLTAPEAGAQTLLVVTFNEALNALTLAINDRADLLASATNDADGTPEVIVVTTATNSVSWDNSDADAPVATITITGTTFVRSRTVRLNFVTDSVQDVEGNAILTATDVDATVVDTTTPTAPTSVILSPVGGSVVANTANGTNTNLIFGATITPGQATGGKAEFYIGGTLIGTDTTVASGDATVTFNPAYTSTATLQAGITAGGVVNCKLYDAAGNGVISTASNPTLIVDYIPPTATITTTGNENGAIIADETLVLTFSEAMIATVINTSNIDTMIEPSGSKTHLDGDGAIGSAVWSAANTVLTVTYSDSGVSPTIVATDFLTPTDFTDVAKNVIVAVAYTVLAGDF